VAKFTLKIDCDNSAFQECQGHEIKRILKDLANNWSLDSANSGVLRDINGNLVGSWRLTGAKA
jgi:hypothetical protein